MLDQLERLPVPRHDALRPVLGISAGPTPDQFLLGLAVLSLLSEVAEGQPLMCLVRLVDLRLACAGYSKRKSGGMLWK
jgi:hypothetical protein